MRLRAPSWGLLPTLVLGLVCVFVAPAVAQPKAKDKAPVVTAPAKDGAKTDAKPDAKKKVQNFDFNAMNLNGASRTPQLLYFLERANEELERAFLERRSFIPHMVRSLDEEAL